MTPTTMTSRTGGGSPPRLSVRGFTLVELLMVIGLIGVLASLLIVVVPIFRARAKEERTRALVRRIEIAMDKYKEVMGQFPPDGMDSPVRNSEGTQIRSTACLYHFLGREFKIEQRLAGGQKRVVPVGPMMDPPFGQEELTPEDPNAPGAFEIVDAFRLPMHYDNLEGGPRSYSPQGGEVHLVTPLVHGGDPRERPRSETAFPREGPQNPGTYDLWSHGLSGEAEEPDPRDTIGNWEATE